ncbi:DUF3617 domain-containing protein [Stutzerimonas stutzeri]|uniref:DUF3617 domain-containing protein n=1 Tax=Stutzerimonas stutzeri TaxID=316 RepID=UPI002109876F|nr:DUF3617 domain-containing protein [Stutzerimonas stutzeri]MCQ4322185.1 DUF3617 domain-containing protein [Stutzerimonas stutzeri]
MKHIVRLSAAALLLAALAVQAEEMLPGLWEFASDDIEVDGMQMPGVEEMVEQMKNLPPDERGVMEEMLAAQGVQLGARGMRICLSEAQVKSRKLPFQDEPGCSQEITEQTDSLWAFTFQCPDAKGKGETRLISEREVASMIESDYQVGTQQGSSRMQSHGKWLSADCGALKPRN